MTRLETTASRSRTFTTMAGRVLWAGVVALTTACGGGGESTPVANVNQPVVTTPPPKSPPPETAYSVVVKTVDTQGQPIAGVSVALISGRDLTADTGSDGTTTFNYNSVPGHSILYATLTGYHTSRRDFQLAPASGPIVQQLTLMRTDEAQLALRGVKSEISADAASVVVNADIAVVGLNGNPIAGLSAADFTVPGLDCLGFGFPCILAPSGEPHPTGYWVPSQKDPVQATLSGTGPSILYNVRYVLEATPGMFTAGSTVFTYVDVRVGADTSLGINVDVRL